ncbi:IQ domain-containing protein K isoform X4 [Acomys russatus]|uniref:IQ domain-containing protein K isoform X4 n=1 Tax=Acomys russatus TaxID=60746 RepID=UPI0021E302E9|nr:IQ domain-containing protein K isoform X4 [Acomys russatus]
MAPTVAVETWSMAAPRQASNRNVQREEAGSSADLSGSSRPPVPAVSPAQVAEPPGKNLWEQICEEYEAELPTFPEGYKVKQEAAVTVSSRKRTKFIACDYLTEWLYNQNPKRAGEPFTEFFSIPFVEEWLKQHPRPPIPISLLLTEEAAAISIQAFWRAYLVRCIPEIQELRQWQKKLREDKHIRQRVKVFWAKQEQKPGRIERTECQQESTAESAAPATCCLHLVTLQGSASCKTGPSKRVLI